MPRRKHIRKPGDLGTLKKKMWLAVMCAQDILTEDHVSTDQRLRAVHALVQAGGAYGKLLETIDLQAQLDTIKAELDILRGASVIPGSETCWRRSINVRSCS